MTLSKLIEETFPVIESIFPDKTIDMLSCMPEKFLDQFNCGIGTMIRLKVLGEPKSELYKSFVANGIHDRDEMAITIIKAFSKYKSTRGQASDPL